MGDNANARLFVGGLASNARTADVEEAFARYGRCSVTLKSTAPGDSRGAGCFAFVQYESSRAAEDAIRNLSGRRIGASDTLRIEFSLPKGEGGGRGGGGGGGGGRERDAPDDRDRDRDRDRYRDRDGDRYHRDGDRERDRERDREPRRERERDRERDALDAAPPANQPPPPAAAPQDAGGLTVAGIRNMRVAYLDDIRAECERRGLDSHGHRRVLAVRLCEALGLSWHSEHTGPVGRLDGRHAAVGAAGGGGYAAGGAAAGAGLPPPPPPAAERGAND